jgi:hypothetical protein
MAQSTLDDWLHQCTVIWSASAADLPTRGQDLSILRRSGGPHGVAVVSRGNSRAHNSLALSFVDTLRR